MLVTIYLATNTTNGKRYVGQTSQRLRRRIRAHINDGRCETLLAKAIRRHGEASFEWEILAECNDPHTADEIEQKYIRDLGTHCATGKGYNRAIGGRVRRGWKHSTETMEKFKGRTSWNKGRPCGPSWNKGRTGWIVSDPERQQELRVQVSKQMVGNRYAVGNKSQRRAVRCVETGEVFESAYHASEWVRGRFERSNISDACRGRRPTAYGYHWEFACP